MTLAHPSPFGTLLKRARRAAHLTQEALAERAGYSVSYLSKLESGERSPLPATVEALAEALGLAASERASIASSCSKEKARKTRSSVWSGQR